MRSVPGLVVFLILASTALTACSARNPGEAWWTAKAQEGTTTDDELGFSACIDSISFAATLDLQSPRELSRDLTITCSVQRDLSKPAPLFEPEVELVEIRSASGKDLTPYLKWISERHRKSEPWRPRIFWSEKLSTLLRKGSDTSPAFAPIQLTGLPAGALTGVARVTVRFHMLVPTKLLTVDLPISSGAQAVTVRDELTVQLHGQTPDSRVNLRWPKLLFCTSNAQSELDSETASMWIWRVSGVDPEGAREPVPCLTTLNKDSLGLIMGLSPGRGSRGESLIAESDILRIEFVTEWDRRAVDVSISDVPM